jgi:HAD superfamily hydrolase (TIGR01509 family)
MNPTTERLAAILFDFDGTLLDSFPAHYEAYQVTMAHFGVEVTPELYRETYSPNWFAMYEAFGIPKDRYEEADRIWLAEAGKHRPRLFPQTRPLLDALSSEFRLGLVTSGSRDRVLRDLASTGIGDYFEVIVTGDDISNPKPDPEGLLIAIDRLAIQPSQALYVGDAREDCLMAQAAGVPFVGIVAEFATVRGVDGCVQLADLSELPAQISLD